MPLTLEQMVDEVKGAVGDSGTCDYDLSKTYINRARRLLWEQKEWNSTCEYVCIQCVDSCFTLPSRYSQVKLAWINNDPASLADEWFNATAWKNLYNNGNSCHRLISEVGGKHVLFRDYTTRPYQIAILAENINDAGVQISFEAYNEYSSYNQETITAVSSPNIAKSTGTFIGVRSVSKPKTNGRIRVYAYDASLDTKTLISIYQPGDVNPSWRRFRAPKGCNCITLYAAKNYSDLDDPMELVEFTPEAIYFAIIAINSKENRNGVEYLKNLEIAVAEEEKTMGSDEIPTAAPLRITDYRRAEGLIGGYMGSPSADDYFFQPSWP